MPGALQLAGLRVGIGQKSSSSVVIELRIFADDALQIRNRRGKIAQPQRGLRPIVERIYGIAARSDRVRERFACFGELLLILVQFAQLFVVRGGRIVQKLRFDDLNAGFPAKPLKHSAQEAEVRQYFRDDVNSCSKKAAEENNKEPVVLRPAAHKVYDREDLQDESPRIEEVA